MEKILCLKHGYQKPSKYSKTECNKCYKRRISMIQKELLKTIHITCEKHGEQNVVSFTNMICKKCYNEERKKNAKPRTIKKIYCLSHGEQRYTSKYRNGCSKCYSLYKKGIL